LAIASFSLLRIPGFRTHIGHVAGTIGSARGALPALPFAQVERRKRALLMGFKTALAVVTFLLAGGLGGRFWPAVALSATAQYILVSVQPEPGYCSIVLFAVELLLLSESRSTESVRLLFWLPPLFLVWANLDLQFVYGILLLGLFLMTTFLPHLGYRSAVEQDQKKRDAIWAKNAVAVAIACGIATFVTPYSYHLYGVFFASLTGAATSYIPDLHAMTFRQPQDYVLMLLTMGAFLALGRRRSRDIFQIALMIGCTILAFHALRNAWLATLAATAVLGEAISNTVGTADSDKRRARNRQVLIAAGLAAAILIVAAALEIPRSHEELMAKVAQAYPVAACDYIREHQLPQPLFNSYDWGGFLTWYLPEYPVAIDSRPGLYEDDFVAQYFKAMNADMRYQAYPAMAQAETLLLQQNSLMGQALRTLPAFQVAYRDGVSIVLIKP